MAIEDNDAFLLTVDKSDLYLYIHNKGDTRAVDYGEGEDFLGNEICNVQVAANNKFFAIGIPSHRALGFFGINRSQLVTKPLKWITKVSSILLNQILTAHSLSSSNSSTSTLMTTFLA